MRLEEGARWRSSGYMQVSHLKETNAEEKDVGVGDTEHEDIRTNLVPTARKGMAQGVGTLPCWGAEMGGGMLGTDFC